MNELALFAGAGGGILGGKLLGWQTVCAVEICPYARAVLASRQNDGTLEAFPIWDDVVTFDGRPWRGIVDVVSGGFPCQDISIAGKGAGIDGTKSGLWREMHRVVCEVRPKYVFVENSPMLTLRGLDRVLCDLAVSGYDAKWGVLGAADLGAPHKRDRIWIVAHDNGKRVLTESESQWQTKAEPDNYGKKKSMADSNSLRELSKQKWDDRTRNSGEELFDSDRKRLHERHQHQEGSTSRRGGQQRKDWPIEPNVGRVAHGVANRVDRIKALGNGQVPRVAATAFMNLINTPRRGFLTTNKEE